MDDLEKVRKGLEATMKAERQDALNLLERTRKDMDDPLNTPADRVQDMEFLPGGMKDPKTIRRAIYKWDDGKGVVFYTRDFRIGLAEARDLRDRLANQAEEFGKLSEEEKKLPDVNQRFSELLTSRSLGEKFEELKRNPPMPFGKK